MTQMARLNQFSGEQDFLGQPDENERGGEDEQHLAHIVVIWRTSGMVHDHRDGGIRRALSDRPDAARHL